MASIASLGGVGAASRKAFHGCKAAEAIMGDGEYPIAGRYLRYVHEQSASAPVRFRDQIRPDTLLPLLSSLPP